MAGNRSKLTDEGWVALLERRLAGECSRALAIEHGVTVDAIAWQARKRGLRKRDRAGAVNLRLRLPAGAPDGARQHLSPLTEGEWRALGEAYVGGEHLDRLSARSGVSRAGLMKQFRLRGFLKRDRADAVWLRRGWAATGGAEGLSFTWDPEDPAGSTAAVLERAREAAVEGRALEFLRLGRAAREAKRLEKVFGAGASTVVGGAGDPTLAGCAGLSLPTSGEGEAALCARPPLVLRAAQRAPAGDG